MSSFYLIISAAQLWGKIWPILFAILFFGIIIMIHEFGHFFTAKLFKMKVNEFAIGMGPKIVSFGKKETKYSLRLLPIGGFVSLEGEDENSEDPRAFGNKPAWQRFIVIAAGAILNILLGLILVSGMLVSQGSVGSKTVSVSHEGTGIEVGDVIVSVNGSHVFSDRDFYYSLQRDDDKIFDITVKRNGEKIKLEDVPITYKFDESSQTTFVSVIVADKNIKVWSLGADSLRETASMTKLIFMSLIDMLSGDYGLNEISGPVGTIGLVADTTSEAVTSRNYSMIFLMLSFITVDIGIINLLPLPALDGGRLFFIFIEFIFRKPVPKKYEAVVHTVGFALLLLLMAVITVNDIRNMVAG